MPLLLLLPLPFCCHPVGICCCCCLLHQPERKCALSVVRKRPRAKRDTALPRPERSSKDEATKSLPLPSPLLFQTHPKINPETEENFSNQKSCPQEPRFHHQTTTNSPQKTIQKTCGKRKTPCKNALPPHPKKTTLPPNISSNQTAPAPYFAPTPSPHPAPSQPPPTPQTHSAEPASSPQDHPKHSKE